MANLLTVADGEPSRVIAGDTVIWRRADLLTDYPSASYSLHYRGRRAGDATASFNVSANSDYQVTVAAAATEKWTPGVYHWQAYVTRTSDSARVTVAEGTFEVVANRATSTADPRSHAARMVAAIEALLEGKATDDVDEYSINGRSLKKIPVAELLKWRDRYKAEALREKAAEDIKRGLATSRRVMVRFQ
jgi:hypothetical protein